MSLSGRAYLGIHCTRSGNGALVVFSQSIKRHPLPAVSSHMRFTLNTCLLLAHATVPTRAFTTPAMHSVLVSGATGRQGGAVVDALLAKPHYKVFGMSRNPDSNAAKRLMEKGVEVLKADYNDKSSIKSAIHSSGASQLFLVTDFQGAKFDRATEKQHGLNCIEAAKECATINFLVFSSVGGCEEVPEAVDAFKSKLGIETALKQSGLRHSILRPHSFFENFNMPEFPLKQGVASGMTPPPVKQHFIACKDIGKAAAVMMGDPETWNGRTLDCAACSLSGTEIGEALSRASGEACVYQQSVFFTLIKWFGHFGFLKGIRALICHIEKHPVSADAAAFRRVVPDAMDAEAYFKSVGRWSNGQPFKL